MTSETLDGFEMAAPYADDRNPITEYLRPLKLSSRRSMEGCLVRAASILAPGVPIDRFAWHLLTIEATLEVRKELSETLRPSTINVVLCALRGVIRAAHDLELTRSDASYRALDVPGVAETKTACGRVLADEEVRRLLDACDANTSEGCRDAAVLALLFGCALRRAEVTNAEVGDVDASTGTLTVRAGASRVISVPKDAMRLLLRWIKKSGRASGPLIISFSVANRGDRIGWCGGILAAIARRANVSDVCHADARCTAITRLFAAGVHELEIHRFSGHAEIDTTLRYAIANPESLRDAVAGFSVLKPHNPDAPRISLAAVQHAMGFASAKSMMANYRGPADDADDIKRVPMLGLPIRRPRE